MKESAGPANEMCSLSVSFHQKLNSYALAASAAGVSWLALAQPSEAKIVYTRTHHVIGNGSSYKLDFNHDGLTDLTFENKFVVTCMTSCQTSHQMLYANLARRNQAVHNQNIAVAMKPGMQIGPKYAFQGGLLIMAAVPVISSSAWGSWINVNNRYLGVKFQIRGETHYGWARLNVQVQSFRITATLTGYAYESVPNKPIIAGKTKDEVDDTNSSLDSANPAESGGSASVVGPASSTPQPALLGMLALGARGIPLWRRQ